jgi:hypothetical protein
MAWLMPCKAFARGASNAKPDLLLQAEAQALSASCDGQAVRLEGNHNTLVLAGPCGSLLLKGVANTVRLTLAPGAPVRIEGSGNRVRYTAIGGGPVIEMFGSDNAVTADAVPTSAPTQSASPPSPRPASRLTLTGDDQERLEDCAGRDVVVSGMRSAYVLSGGCRSLTVTGDLLTVQAELQAGARIAITGRGSIVSWALERRGRGPATVVHGAGSRAQHVDMIGGRPVGGAAGG